MHHKAGPNFRDCICPIGLSGQVAKMQKLLLLQAGESDAKRRLSQAKKSCGKKISRRKTKLQKCKGEGILLNFVDGIRMH